MVDDGQRHRRLRDGASCHGLQTSKQSQASMHPDDPLISLIVNDYENISVTFQISP
jgi:hypothetical protein